MKKIIAIVLVLAMVFSFTACGSASETPVETIAPIVTVAPATTAPTEAPVATETPVATVAPTSSITYILKDRVESDNDDSSSDSEPTAVTWEDITSGDFSWSDSAYYVSDTETSSVDDIENLTYSGTIEFADFAISSDTTINMPKATLVFNNVDESTNILTLTSGPNTNIFKGTVKSPVKILGGNVEVEGSVSAIEIATTEEISVSAYDNGRVEELTVADATTANISITTQDSGYVKATNNDSSTISATVEDTSQVDLDNKAGGTASVTIPEGSQGGVSTDGEVTLESENEDEDKVLLVGTAPTSQIAYYGVIFDATSTTYATIAEALAVEAAEAIVLTADITETTSPISISATQIIDTNGYNWDTTTNSATVTNAGTIKAGTQTSLQSALSAGGNITVTQDIETTETFYAEKEFKLSGEMKNGEYVKIETTATDEPNNTLFSLDGTNGTNGDLISFENLRLVTTTKDGYNNIAVRIGNFTGAEIKFDNVAMTSLRYTMLVDISNEEIKVTIDNSDAVSGWCGILFRPDNSTLEVNNSTMVGSNTMFSGSSNGYSTITIQKSGSTGEGEGAENNTLTFTNSTIIASSIQTDNEQKIITTAYGAKNNSISFIDCEIIQATVGDDTHPFWYNEFAWEAFGYYRYATGNHVYVNGIEQTFIDGEIWRYGSYENTVLAYMYEVKTESPLNIAVYDFTELKQAIEDGETLIYVHGNIDITSDFEIPSGVDILNFSVITIESGVEITVNGTLYNSTEIINKGTILNIENITNGTYGELETILNYTLVGDVTYESASTDFNNLLYVYVDNVQYQVDYNAYFIKDDITYTVNRSSSCSFINSIDFDSIVIYLVDKYVSIDLEDAIFYFTYNSVDYALQNNTLYTVD